MLKREFVDVTAFVMTVRQRYAGKPSATRVVPPYRLYRHFSLYFFIKNYLAEKYYIEARIKHREPRTATFPPKGTSCAQLRGPRCVRRAKRFD